MSPTSATDPPKRRVAPHPSDGWPRRSGANLALVMSHSMQDSEDFVCSPANVRFTAFAEAPHAQGQVGLGPCGPPANHEVTCARRCLRRLC